MSKENFHQRGRFSDLNVDKREKEREENWQLYRDIVYSLLESINEEVYNGGWRLEEDDRRSRIRLSRGSCHFIYVEQGKKPDTIEIAAGGIGSGGEWGGSKWTISKEAVYRLIDLYRPWITDEVGEQLYETAREALSPSGVEKEHLQRLMEGALSYVLREAIKTIEEL